MLDVAGVVCDPADLLNAGISACRGRWKEAALNGVCVIPIIGNWLAKGVKGLKRAKAAGAGAEAVLKIGKTGAKALDRLEITYKAMSGQAADLKRYLDEVTEMMQNASHSLDPQYRFCFAGTGYYLDDGTELFFKIVDDAGDSVSYTRRIGNAATDGLDGVRDATRYLDEVIESGSRTIPLETETRLYELIDEARKDINKSYPIGNVGVAVTDIEGVSSEIKSYSKYNNSISSPNINHEYSYNFGENNRIFSTKPINSANIVNGPGAYNRAIDSEAKILEDIAHQLGYNKFCVDESIQGNVYLLSERAPCPSCQSVIEQFRQMFPNVNVIVKNKY